MKNEIIGKSKLKQIALRLIRGLERPSDIEYPLWMLQEVLAAGFRQEGIEVDVQRRAYSSTGEYFVLAGQAVLDCCRSDSFKSRATFQPEEWGRVWFSGKYSDMIISIYQLAEK
ncbi:hypothetical protein K8T06_15665 [bacterium]|nr:hypothetical protein [bacterium]